MYSQLETLKGKELTLMLMTIYSDKMLLPFTLIGHNTKTRLLKIAIAFPNYFASLPVTGFFNFYQLSQCMIDVIYYA